MRLPNIKRSLRDILVVALYHLDRVRRTRAALAQVAIFLLVSTVSAMIAHRILSSVERTAAMAKGQLAPDKPGAMYDAFVQGSEFAELVPSGLGVGGFVEWAATVPYMPLTWFLSSMVLMPFLGVGMGWGAIASDLSGRTLRFEAIRAGRTEIFVGRFFGMSFLMLLALACAALVPLLFSQFLMVEQPLWTQIVYLLNFIPRAWFWALPFLALGVTCSSLVSNSNSARSISITILLASWWLHSLCNDFFAHLFPQAWVGGLYGPGYGWLGSGLALLFISALLLIPGVIVLKKRDI